MFKNKKMILLAGFCAAQTFVFTAGVKAGSCPYDEYGSNCNEVARYAYNNCRSLGSPDWQCTHAGNGAYRACTSNPNCN